MIINVYRIKLYFHFTVVSKSEIMKTDETMETNQCVSNSINNKYPVWLGSSKKKKLIKRNRKINKLKKKELKKSLHKRK